MPRARRTSRQLGLAARGQRGGYRKNAGRKPKPEGTHLGHRPRPALASRFPVHVTLKVRPSLPNLRRRAYFQAVHAALRDSRERHGFRLVHFTVQGNHLHLLCEGTDQPSVSRGMHALAIRVARRINRQADRRGAVFAERFHERILRSPREVRRALAYVLNNSRRHAGREVGYAPDWIDARSSAPWFSGWTGRPRLYEPAEPDCPVVPAVTWLLTTGWRRHGLLRPDEVPGGLTCGPRTTSGGRSPSA